MKKNGPCSLFDKDGGTYSGNCVEGKSNGFGIYKYSDGKKYEGSWKDGQPDGKGKLSLPDGATYEGDFQQGKLHGRGTFIYSDGSKFVGEYKNGKRNGDGVLYTLDGTKSCIWIDGKCDVETKKSETLSNEGNFIFLNLVSATENEKTCQLKFEIQNKTNKKMSDNKIIAVVNMKGNNRNNPEELIDFPVLGPGDSVSATKEIYKNVAQHARLKCADIVKISDVKIFNIRNFYLDKFDANSLKLQSSAGTISFEYNPEIIGQGLLSEKRNDEYHKRYDTDPVFKASEDKKRMHEACINSCQKQAEICVIDYGLGRSGVNEVCGLPRFQCIQDCK